MRKMVVAGVMAAVMAVRLFSQEAPTGSSAAPGGEERKSLERIKGKVAGLIAWSSSRGNSRHKIWVMNADGTDARPLTKGDKVDWFSRFSPDGATVLFCRSKYGWEAEGDADVADKWELWTIGVDGANERKVADNAVWGTWRPSGDSIVFARGPKVVVKCLADGNEKEVFDAEKSLKKGTNAQQPSLSPDGRFLAATLRGSKRDCGIWNFAKNEWYTTGGGCEITWFPDGRRVLRVNEGQGNGGTEILSISLDADGRPADRIGGFSLSDKVRFMDLPGRRSHEYFPKLDQTGQWMVWAATQYGHEHDIADYEIYLWNITTDKKKDFVRLTFNTCNDRWPDIATGGPARALKPDPAVSDSATKTPMPQPDTMKKSQ